MNQLSWLLYIANVSGTLSAVTAWLAILCLIGGAACLLVWVGNKDCALEQYQTRDREFGQPYLHTRTIEDLKEGKDFLKTVKQIWKTLFTASTMLLVLTIITPRAETVYAIAASEMGEQILKTPTASKAAKALESWLDKQIRENSK